MDYNKIVAVTGMPGLYEVVSSKTDGAIVRSLEDQSTKFISSRIHNLSHLESIEVYTVRDNVTLSDVFISMKEGNTGLPDVKDNQALKTYFEKVFPDLDFDRVYSSDLKKMVKWFEVLKQNEVDFTVKPKVEEEETSEGEAKVVETKKLKVKPEVKAAEPIKETPAKKTAAKENTEKETPAKEKKSKPAASKTAAAKPKAAKDKPKAAAAKPKKAAKKK